MDVSSFARAHCRRAVFIVFFASLLAACGAADRPMQAAETAVASAEPTTESVYVCPMHPHVQQHGPGTCPICGMTLVEKAAPPAAGEREILYWYDPMRPEVQFDRPGKSPFMDMDLVPRYADEAAPGSAGVTVDPALAQSLGIRAGQVVRETVRPRFRVPARVAEDARGVARVQARSEGWVERLHVRAEGDPVRAGAVVAEIYAPEWVRAQEELLLGDDIAIAAAERLRRFGIAEADIRAIRDEGRARRRLPLRAPVAGVVRSLSVREGARVGADGALLEIVPRASVWLEAQLFPHQIAQLGSARAEGEFRLPGLSDRLWRAESTYVEPAANPATQTVTVRFAVDNTDGTLPLGAWLDAEIAGAAREGVLLSPASAVIRSADGARVVRARDDGRYAVQAVAIGARYGDRLEIREGLDEGDRIVVSGQFLLDAEADLRGGLERLNAAPAAAPADEHAHGAEAHRHD